MLKVTLTVIIIYLMSFSELSHAKCAWDINDPFHKTRNFTYDGGDISLPANAADGKIFEATFTSYYTRIQISCSPIVASGMKVNTAVSFEPANTEEFNFKSGNYYWKFKLDGYFFLRSIASPGENFNMGGGSDYAFSNRFVLSIYKRGDVNESFTIPAGLLGVWTTKDGFEVAQVTLLNPITINAASCQTPSFNVDMGEYDLSDLKKDGVGKDVAFNIGLFDCPSSISNIEYLLKANNLKGDSSLGIIALDDTSTSKGVELQIKGKNGIPLKLDAYHKWSATGGIEGGTIKIPLSASYLLVPGEEITPGKANAAVTFIIRYL